MLLELEGRRPQLRQDRGAPRDQPGGRRGRGRRADRRQRRRQDHHDAGHLGRARPSRPARISFNGEDITKLRADQRVRKGLCLSPEGRGVFPGMTVIENLDMGAYTRKDKAAIAEDFDRVFDLFPRLNERRKQVGGTMSGGEQQMLAIGRALMSRPKLLLLDEPSMGLAPMLIQQIFDIITEINAAGHDDPGGRAERQAGALARRPGLRPGDRHASSRPAPVPSCSTTRRCARPTSASPDRMAGRYGRPDVVP